MENTTTLRSKLTNSALIGLATLAIMLAKLLTQSSSFFLWGEPKCPKSLLK